jgi:tRNA (adenine22-N1)-methyltransferase
LQKARNLLSDYIEKGKAVSVVSDGFDKVKGADIALIAGMGGEEICSILSREKTLPETLVLQPMKNPEKVRSLLLELKYKFVKDSVFKSAGKFYDLLVLVKGEDFLTEEEIEFGRDNLKGNNQDFKDRLLIEISRINEYLYRDVSENTKAQLSAKLEKYKKYV